MSELTALVEDFDGDVQVPERYLSTNACIPRTMKHKIHGNTIVQTGSRMFELMEIAQKTGKPEDQKRVSEHAKALELAFNKQCGLPHDHKHRPWSIGRGYYDLKDLNK